MKSLIAKITFFILCVGIAAPLSAQTKKEPKKTEAKQVRIDLVDGSSIEGKLIARRGDTVVVESATFGVLNLHIKNIKNIDAVSTENLKNGQSWFENIHAPHGYFAPTAFNFRKGEGYYGNIFLFFSQVGYGFTDHFSISGGTEMISIFFGDGSGSSGRRPQFFYLNPKFSYQVDKSVTLGVGALILFTGEGNVPIPYGIATLGNRNTNLSVGLGVPIVSGSNGTNNKPVFMLGGQARVLRGVSLMTENYIAKNEFSNSSSGIGTTGFRFMSKSIAFNIGLMYLLGDNGGNFFDLGSGNGNSPFAPFPFLGLNVPFGKPKK